MTLLRDLQLQGVQPTMLFLHGIVVEEFNRIGKPWYLSSGVRRRGIGSLHPKGQALDYRSKHLTPDERELVLKRVVKRVAGHFDFIWEKTVRDGTGRVVKGEHFHGEYDPK